ncbi:polysaccharide deacetylase family protein [bacterium]|nr:polysaccharide deacetylase family protein [bacterium]
MGWHGKCTALLLLALSLTMATAASKMNTGYLLPGHEFKVAPSASGDISRFCALTFDDGPDSKYTPKVMKILRDEGVSATFFVIGRQVRGYPEQVRQMVADGHEVANHSWSHADFTKLSAKAQRAELDKCSAALAELNISPRWFRPPYGAFNKSTTRQAQEAGLIPLLWSVDPRDWAEPGAGVIISRVSSQVTNGGVVLLHSTHGQTVEALPGLIRKLRDKGYSFVTLSQWQALVTGQQLPVPVSPGLPEQLENYRPDTTQPGDSLPGIADGATPEDLQIPELPGQGTPLIRVEPFTLKPRPGENAGAESPAADSMVSADGGQQPASGPYEITEEDALAPRESREWQFATPPTLQDLIDGLPEAEELVPSGSAVPEDSLGRANALRLRALAGRVLALRIAAEAPAGGVLDIKAPEPLHIHSNFRSAEELERWLR